MYCPKCGCKVEENTSYCGNCGNFLNRVQQNNINPQISNQNNLNNLNTNINNNSINNFNSKSNKDNKNKIFLGLIAGIAFLAIIIIFIGIISIFNKDYYFDYTTEDDVEINQNTSSNSNTNKNNYTTAIVYDNYYDGVSISNNEDAYNLIIKDSNSQKDSCPNEIKKIEEDIINKYGITAVNLCEMNTNFAKELDNVFKKIYEEYPSVRGYITNVTLVNGTMQQSYIAAFMPAFQFASANSENGYPLVFKTQILLNSTYFLNSNKLKYAVEQGSSSGHFPKNATMYSPVAHELGHYLSFLAMMKSYNLDSFLLVNDNNIKTFYDVYNDFVKGYFSLKMINEAFEKYKNDTNTTMTLDEWRGTISAYALAQDNSGEYIYDETIAESFHDVYLNGNKAADASKYIVAVLKKKLEG